MNTTGIDLMLAEKGNPCVSIVVPTHQYSRERMQNPEIIEKSIQKAKNLLANSAWPQDKVRQLMVKFDSILENIDYLRLQEALAIFISPNILKIQLLPFAVKEKVMLGQSFEIRDMVYFDQFLKPYFLLAASKKRIRLFKGSGRDLQEVINTDFPKEYIEEYEYAYPSLGSTSSVSLTSFERDKSVVREQRMQTFLKQADIILNKYLKEDELLFVAGVEEVLSDFSEITRHKKNLAGKIPGNYDFDALHPLAEAAWNKVKDFVKASHQELLIKLRENFGKKLTVAGIRNVWRAANEGKGLTLFVEKDYQVIGYCESANKSELYLTQPEGKHDTIIDAADEAIKIVKEKGGDVIIVENGELDNFLHIAMLLRYEA